MTTIQQDVDESSTNEDAPLETEEQINHEEQDDIVADEPVMSDHDKLIMELGAKRKHEGAEETVDSLEDEVDDDDDPAYDDPADELVTLKVNGQEIQRTQEEVDEAGGIAAIQKQISGDMKLKAAAEQRKENERQQAEAQRIFEENQRLKAENAQLRSVPYPAPVISDELTAEEKAEAQVLTDKMFQGDATELQSVMEQMVKAKRQAKAQPQQVNQPIDKAALAKEVEFEIDKNRAIASFDTNHEDISKSKVRRNVVNDFTKEVYSEHPTWMPTQIMEESIKRARVELNLPDPNAKKVDEKLVNKKNKKKNAADVIPQANQRRDTSKPKVKVMTKRELFEDIAAKRSHG